jgi:RNA polymerase sigma-70 factor (ECF subfamily)
MDEPGNNKGRAPLASIAGDELSDNELVESVLAGDELAFETLFHRYRLAVGRVASRFFQQRQQVEEIVQESFAKAYFALKDYNGKNERSFAAWLLRIAANTSYDELRRAKRNPESTGYALEESDARWLQSRLHGDAAGGDIEADAITRDLAHKLLDRLGPEDRLVLTLLNGEELSVIETAEVTGWSVAKVKVRAHRARLALRKLVGRLL